MVHELKIAFFYEYLMLKRQKQSFILLGFFLILAMSLLSMTLHFTTLPSNFTLKILWLLLIFGIYQRIPYFFQEDAKDGTLNDYILSPLALEWRIFLRLLLESVALWIFFGGILLCAILFLNLDQSIVLQSLLLAALCIPLLVYSSGLCGALLIRNNKGALLLPLLLLPLQIPTLFFTLGSAPLYLIALLLIQLPLSCWGTAWILKNIDT